MKQYKIKILCNGNEEIIDGDSKTEALNILTNMIIDNIDYYLSFIIEEINE